MASNDSQWPWHQHTLHPNEHLSLHVNHPSLSISLCLCACLFMLSACHLSISVFITVSASSLSLPSDSLLGWLTLSQCSLPIAVCFWSPLYLYPTLCQSQGFSLSLSLSPHQLSFIDVFLDALCFPPRSFLLHLPLSLSLSVSRTLCLHSHSEPAHKPGTVREQKVILEE